MKFDLLTYNNKPSSFNVDNALSTRLFCDNNLVLECGSYRFFAEQTDIKVLLERPNMKYFPIKQIKYMQGKYFICTDDTVMRNQSHFLSQLIRSLLLAKKYGIDFTKIPVVVPKLDSRKIDFIQLIGDFNIIEIERDNNLAFIFEKAIYSDSLLGIGKNISYETITLFNEFRDSLNIPQKFKDKIYISRKDVLKRPVLNENEVITFMQKKGFEILELAKLPLLDQVSAFAHAKVVVGPHGAGTSNMYFAQNGTTLIELFSEGRVTNCHAKIAYAKDCFYHGTLNKGGHPIHNKDGAYIIDIPLLEKALSNPIKFSESKPNPVFFIPFDQTFLEYKEEGCLRAFLKEDQGKMCKYAQERIEQIMSKLSHYCLYNYKADIEKALGNKKEAIQYYFKALEDIKLAGKIKIPIFRKLFQLCILKDDINNAKKACALAQNDFSTWADPYICLARIYEKKNNIIEAVEQVQKVLELEPQNQKYKEIYVRLLKEREKSQAVLMKNQNDKIQEQSKEISKLQDRGKQMKQFQEQINNQQMQINTFQRQVKLLIIQSNKIKSSSCIALKNIAFQLFLKKRAFALCNSNQLLEAKNLHNP